MRTERTYQSLRTALYAAGYTNEDAAALIGISKGSFSASITGKRPWTQDEMWQLMDALDEPDGRMSLLFPRRRKEMLLGLRGEQDA